MIDALVTGGTGFVGANVVREPLAQRRSLRDMIGPYKASKFLAEQVALGFAHQGLPVVIVNPSAPVGPWDVKPTPTGQMVVDFLAGRMVATLDTGLNLVHVRDVARGHLLAGERGKIGEKYILGSRNRSRAHAARRSTRSTRSVAPWTTSRISAARAEPTRRPSAGSSDAGARRWRGATMRAGSPSTRSP